METQNKQPEALRLANQCNRHAILSEKAAAELRRQHALIAELVEALKSIANYPELDALEMKREARAALSKAKE